MPPITLLTDFGTADEYVGLMKGVILSINPAATIVDITHQLEPQDIVGAAHLIQSSYRYFPSGTVHLAIVDPGVGGDRKMICLKVYGHLFLAPDNGLLSLLLRDAPVDALHYIENTDLFLDPVSRTFHGRDVFAPVGAHLSLGVGIGEIGRAADRRSLVLLDLPKPRESTAGELVCDIIAIDRFGNLITNLDEGTLRRFHSSRQPGSVRFRVADRTIIGLSQGYSGVSENDLLAVIGSRGYLEIAVNTGDAHRLLGVEKGDRVRVAIGE